MIENSQVTQQRKSPFNQLINTVSEVFQKTGRFQCELEYEKSILQMKQKMFQIETEKIEKMIEIKNLTKKCSNQKLIIQILQIQKQQGQRKEKLARDQIKELEQMIEEMKKQKEQTVESYEKMVKGRDQQINKIEQDNSNKYLDLQQKLNSQEREWEEKYNYKQNEVKQLCKIVENQEYKMKEVKENYQNLKNHIFRTFTGQEENTNQDAISLLEEKDRFIKSVKNQIGQAQMKITKQFGKKTGKLLPSNVDEMVEVLIKLYLKEKQKIKNQLDTVVNQLNALLRNQNYPQEQKGSYVTGQDLVDSVKKIVNQSTSVQKQLRLLEAQKEANVKLIAERERYNREVNKQIQKQSREGEELSKTVSELKSSLETERREKEEIRREREKINDLLSRLKSQKSNKEGQKIKAQEDNISKLNQQIQGYQKRMAMEKKETQQLKQTIEKLERERNSLKSTLDNIKKNKSEELLKSTKILQQLTIKLKEQINDKEIEIQTLQQQRNLDQQKHTQQINQLKEKIQISSQSKPNIQIDQLTAQLIDKSQKLQQANQKMRSMQQKIDKLFNENKSQDAKLYTMQQQIVRIAKIKYPTVSSFQQSLQLFEQLSSIKQNVQAPSESISLFVPPFISQSFQANMEWVKNLLAENIKIEQKIKTRFVGKVSKSGQDYSKFLENPNTVIICQTPKSIFCIFITKLGKTQTDNDPVIIFSPSQQLRYPKISIKGKGYRTSFVNLKGDLILGKIEVIIQKTPFQISVTKQTLYFGQIDYPKIFGMSLGQKLPILSMEFYCLQK